MEMLSYAGQPAPIQPPAGSYADCDDLELVRWAQAGEEAAFSELVRRHSERVYRHCMRYLANESDADDVVQTVFSNMFRHLHRFEPRCKFSTWLYRIATNACIDHARHTRRMMDRIEPAPMRTDGGAAVIADWEHPDESYSPESEYNRRELQVALVKALETLSPVQREAFEMAELEGLKYEEIARRAGVSLGSVKSRIFNARRKLMAALESYRS